MSPILDVLIPAVLVLLMLVVGLGLRQDDFRRLRERRLLIVVASLGQIVLLPLLAAGLARVFDPGRNIAIGMVLLAACPGGAISNFYCHLARVNVALSVVLTSVASLASLVTLPVAATLGLSLIAVDGTRVVVPVKPILLQLLVFVILPVVAGMVVRWRWSAPTERVLPLLNGLSVLGVIGVIVAIFIDQADAVVGDYLWLVGLAVAFTVLAFAMGAAIGRMLGRGRDDIIAVGVEFTIRNLAVMALVAVTAFGEPEFLLFGAVFFVVQMPLILLAAVLIRRQGK